MPVQPYPPVAPTISGNLITVDAFLNNPARVQRVINDLTTQRFIADVIFSTGPQASGGAVVYDQPIASDLYTSRDVQPIQPGGEYPNLTDAKPSPKVATVTKWGGKAQITDEARDRNNFDTVNRELTKLGNTIVRKVDSVAVATLEAAVTASLALTYGGADWTSSSNDILGQLAAARLVGDALDLGYSYDTVLINPIQAADLLINTTIRTALTNSARQLPLIADANPGQLMGFDFIVSNRISAGVAYMVDRKTVGGVSDEVPLRSQAYRDEDTDSTWVKAARRVVPYVTDPKALIKLTSI